jgi:hypothetical protein
MMLLDTFTTNYRHIIDFDFTRPCWSWEGIYEQMFSLAFSSFPNFGSRFLTESFNEISTQWRVL